MKRLYRVAVEVTVYVLAANKDEARQLAQDEGSVEVRGGLGEVWVSTVGRGHTPAAGWGRGSILYGSDGETTLGEALDALEGK